MNVTSVLSQRGEQGLVANSEIGAVRVLPELDHASHFEWRRGGTRDDQLAAAAHPALQFGGNRSGRDHQVHVALAHPVQVVDDAEGHVLFGKHAEHTAMGALAAAEPASRAEHQHACVGDLSHVILLVRLQPGEDRPRGLERRAVGLLERAVHVQRGDAAGGHVLPQARADLRLRHGGEPPREVDERHALVDGHLMRVRVAGPAHVVARGVRPQRQRASHRRVRLREHHVGDLRRGAHQRGGRPLRPDQFPNHLGHADRGVVEERPVVGVGRLGQVAAGTSAKQAAAIVAMAEAQRIAAVVRRRVAEHVEEQAVHVVAVERLGEDLDGFLPVPSAVDARLVEAVVDGRLAVGLLEEPLRMRVEGVLAGLAQVEAADDADAARMRLPEHLAESVLPGGNGRADVVQAHLAGVERRDAAHLHQQDVGVEVRDLGDERPRVQAASVSRRLVCTQRMGSRIHHCCWAAQVPHSAAKRRIEIGNRISAGLDRFRVEGADREPAPPDLIQNPHRPALAGRHIEVVVFEARAGRAFKFERHLAGEHRRADFDSIAGPADSKLRRGQMQVTLRDEQQRGLPATEIGFEELVTQGQNPKISELHNPCILYKFFGILKLRLF